MVKKIFIVLGIVVAIAVGWIVVSIGPRNIIGILTYGRQAREGSLRVGDRAPLVSLVDLDGTTLKGLDAWIGDKPLVLVFGSFT